MGEEKEMANFIQYINMGFVVIDDIQEVDEWNIDYAVYEALKKNKCQEDCYIIGFRFLEKENQILKHESGIYYLDGTVISNPVEDIEVFRYCEEKDIEVPCFPVIKIKQPFLMVFPFEKQDQVIDAAKYKQTDTVEAKKAKITVLRKEISDYKRELLQEMEIVSRALDAEEFSLIPLIGDEKENGKRFLNLCGDEGDFGRHLRYLYLRTEELRQLQEDIINS